MKIAFTYNLKTTSLEEEAEFDTQETVKAISDAIASLGHQVEPLEVSGPVSRTIARLEALSPDLVFNTAEGKLGKYREAFYPGIFEQLDLPFTGSDAYVCNLTLDKYLTKQVLENTNIPMPKSIFVSGIREIKNLKMRYPLIIKPNYEGSSKGITENSVVENEEDLRNKLPIFLKKYSNGVLIEEFIPGKDVTVAFIEGKGILPPAEYVFDKDIMSSRKYMIYDYDLKNNNADKVSVRVPAHLTPYALEKIVRYADTVFKTLGIRDFGRADFRVTPYNEVFFIEVNALPSLEPDAGIYNAAKLIGLENMKDVIDAIIQSSVKRNKISGKKLLPKKINKQLKVGFTYNEKRIIPGENPLTDAEAEYDAPKTLNAIRDALKSYGHEVIDLEATSDLPFRISSENVDVVFNISEGLKGRNRESQIPALLELLNIPYTGSDPATLSLTLDKALAKRVVKESGVLTPTSFVFVTGKEKLPKELRFPLIIKPVAEGSSKGVLFGKSVVHTESEAKDVAMEIIKRYKQPALAEEFLTGREFTVALLGETRPKVLPPMEIVFTDPNNKYPIYAYHHKLNTNNEVRYDTKPNLDSKLRLEIEKVAKKSFMALGCRDFARIDLRQDEEGKINFIECNPLPGLTPGWSDMCLIAESAGLDYRNLIGEILAPAIRRYKSNKKIFLHKDMEEDFNYVQNREEM